MTSGKSRRKFSQRNDLTLSVTYKKLFSEKLMLGRVNVSQLGRDGYYLKRSRGPGSKTEGIEKEGAVLFFHVFCWECENANSILIKASPAVHVPYTKAWTQGDMQ